VSLVQTNSTNAKGVSYCEQQCGRELSEIQRTPRRRYGSGGFLFRWADAPWGRLQSESRPPWWVVWTPEPLLLPVRRAGGTASYRARIKGMYGRDLAAGGIPSSGGTFTFTGSGGVDVGSFTSTDCRIRLLHWTIKAPQ